MNTDRFKYRVWDNDLQQYVSELVFFNHHGEVCLIETGYFYRHKTVIEQCTGVQDQNGKPIYEGDIVRTILDWIGVVTWEDGRFLVKFDNGADCGIYPTEEVIGNIHKTEGTR